MLKHAYLLHGWGGTPTGAWKPWLQKELEARGVHVVCPQLPNAENPTVEEWVPFLESLITSTPEETLVMAHSLSVPATLMYLERQREGARFAKIIFVGGVYRSIDQLAHEEVQTADPWLTHLYNIPRIRTVAPRITAFFSDDDHHIPLSTRDAMVKDFGVTAITDHACGHYNGLVYPQFLNEIEKSL